MKLENVIYSGDNLTWLKKFPDKLVDLIYLDPPFFSNRHYEVIFNDGEEIRSFEDRWKGGINHYIGWMKERVFELHRVLKDTGSFYLHCDWHASHYLKVMCDEIFEYNNFQNEIVWQKIRYDKSQSNNFAKLHDIILFYSKTNKYIYNQQHLSPSQEYIKKYYSQTEPITNRKYQLACFFQGGQGPPRRFGDKILEPPSGKHWIWSQERIDEAMKEGRLVFTDPNKPRLKRYLDEYGGRNMGTIWDDIFPVNAVAKERYGYPTQKPEALMERIIKASSNKNDLVLDPFCGCGTTIAVAQRLQRKWIGIDVSPSACKLMKNRVEKNGARGTEIIGQPLNIKELKALPPFEFQNWCVGALGGTVNPKKVGDMGIDGFTFMNRYPIQVKQSEGIGRNVIDNFETALQRANQDMGYIIAFSFGKGAYEEVAEAKQRGLHIDLLTVDKLLEYEEPAGRGKIF